LTVCGGISARLFRLSFSGELAYEISVPSRYGNAIAGALMTAGEPFNIAPYGTEALGVMRVEKGHIAGNEIDGRTTAHDLGFGRLMSPQKDFIGRVMSGRRALTAPARPRLVGVRSARPSERLHAGAHLLPLGAPTTAADDQGVVTSVAYSPSLDHWIGLALLARGTERFGEKVVAADPVRNASTEVEVCSACFIDPNGERMRV
jgi:methylglutamate dehydrogenase subunit C